MGRAQAPIHAGRDVVIVATFRTNDKWRALGHRGASGDKNQSGVTELLRLSFYQIHRIMERAVMCGMADRIDAMETGRLSVTTIGIDEKCYHYWKFITVISDSVRGAILDVSEGRTTSAAKQAVRLANIYLSQRIASLSLAMAALVHAGSRQGLSIPSITTTETTRDSL